MSNAEKKIVSAICMTHGIALRISAAYHHRPGCKDIKRRLEKLDEACTAAFELWKDQIDHRTMLKMTTDFLRIDEACLKPDNGKTMETAVLTSMALGMLSDVLDHVKEPHRVEALLWVHDSMARVHRYFDSRLDRHAHYERATEGIDAWHRVMEAA